ncbi:MAG: BatD family protein [Candidatus Erginobacter occultus]|nr:BatD family protein [Candidatus Erginobacter occultus]
MGRWINIILLVFALAPTTGAEEEISFTASVDRATISRLDQLTYTLSIDGARDARPVLPDIPGFEVIGSSTSTQFSLVNNQTRINQAISYTLIPLGTGEFTIPPARLTYDGKTYLTRPVQVKVVDGPAPAAALPSSPPAGQPATPGRTAEPAPPPPDAPQLFITTGVDREEAYVNQQVTLAFKLYRRLRVANLNYSPPPTTGFIEESLGEEKTYGQVRDGLRYEVLELARAVFPISAGELTIGPAELKEDILVPRQSRRVSPFGFDDFFGGAFAGRQPFVLRSEPITLSVKPLPRENRPEDFRGAVGRFDLAVTAAPSSVRAGEPVTVTMTVRGRGNLDAVTVPTIPAGSDFQTYTPEVEIRKDASGGRLGGEKVFKQVLIPLNPEVREIPAVTFSYFDPERGEYRTLTSSPIPVEVAAAPDRETLRLVEDAVRRSGGEEVRLLSRDILYIKSDPGRIRPRGNPYYRRPGFWAAVLLSPLIILAARLVTARRERIREDITFARRVGASRSARKRFKKARRLLAAGPGEKFYGEVHRAFNRYLGDKFLIPAGAVTAELIAGKLAAAGADESLAGEVEDCLAAFDRARFSGSASRSGEMKAFLSRVEKLVGKLEKIKVR